MLCEHAGMFGARVLDLSESITGAYAGRLLAAMGAEVVVGERSGGSPLRTSPPMISTAHGPRSATWEYLGAMKQSLVLPEAEEAVIGLAGSFDVVLLATDGGGRPLRALADRLRHSHPRLSVVAVTPFGLTGPYADWRAGPLELWAVGGHMGLTGLADRHPLPGGGPWESYLVGATAALAAQAALLQPGGVLADVGAMQALVGAHQWTITAYTHVGYVKKRAGNRLGEMHHPICIYPCSDGWVCIAAASSHQWEGLCIAMDQVELLADDELANAAARFDRADELDQIIQAWTSSLTVAEAVTACQANFCPAGPVNDFLDVLASEQLAFRDYWASAAHLGPAVVMPGVPFRLDSTPPWSPAPELGAHIPVEHVPVEHPTVLDSPSADSASPPDATEAGSFEPLSLKPLAFKPLAGVRVIELTISWAGPLAARYLAELGADVIKVEHPTSRGVAVSPPDPDAEPDPWTRGQLLPVSIRNGVFPDGDPGADWWNRMGHFNKMNRSKRSLCLDIKAPGGREVFERLVATADIVINNYSPRGVRSLGIDHETLRAIRPDLVTVAMSGFGATGPGAEAVSWGPILDAASGLAATTGYADSGPFKQGVAYPDPIGGTHGAAAVLAAWWERQRTGEPVHVDLSQLETLLFVAGDQIVETSANAAVPPRRGARSAVHAPAGVYRCHGDDTWVALTIYDDADWSRLAAVVPGLGRAAWGDRSERRADHDAIDALIEAWTSARTNLDAMESLQSAGIAAAIVSSSADLVEDPHLNARGFFVDLTHQSYGPRRFPGSAIMVDGEPLEIRPLSALGADNDEVLDSLRFGADERQGLRASGAIAARPPS